MKGSAVLYWGGGGVKESETGATKGKKKLHSYYYSPDRARAGKVSNPLAPALNGKTMLMAGCI